MLVGGSEEKMDKETIMYLKRITEFSTPEKKEHSSDSYQKLCQKYCDLRDLARDCLEGMDFSDRSRIKINSLILEVRALNQEKIPTS